MFSLPNPKEIASMVAQGVTAADRLSKAIGSLADATNRQAEATERQNDMIAGPAMSPAWDSLR